MMVLLYSTSSNALISTPQAMTVYLFIMSPMLYQALKKTL